MACIPARRLQGSAEKSLNRCLAPAIRPLMPACWPCYPVGSPKGHGFPFQWPLIIYRSTQPFPSSSPISTRHSWQGPANNLGTHLLQQLKTSLTVPSAFRPPRSQVQPYRCPRATLVPIGYPCLLLTMTFERA